MLAAEPTEKMLPAEATEPIERIDPAEPMLKIEPAEPMDRIDPLDPMLKIEPVEPVSRCALPVIPMHGIIAAFVKVRGRAWFKSRRDRGR